MERARGDIKTFDARMAELEPEAQTIERRWQKRFKGYSLRQPQRGCRSSIMTAYRMAGVVSCSTAAQNGKASIAASSILSTG